MAIRKRVGNSGKISYQVKIKVSNNWITKTFKKKREAELYESEIKRKYLKNYSLLSFTQNITLDEFWNEWCSKSRVNTSEGWKQSQNQMYKDYVKPVLGTYSLQSISPIHIKEVLGKASNLGRSPQTITHIYNLLNKIFNDACEDYEYIEKNPVKKSMKPVVPIKKQPSLSIAEIYELIRYVLDKRYGLAIILQIFCGLRVGEVQVLKWSDIDLDTFTLHVRRTYLRKTKAVQDYTKGKKQFTVPIPQPLIKLLANLRGERELLDGYIFSSEQYEFLSYHSYYNTLKTYCRELGLPKLISTHSLRHSTATLWLHHGASKDDLPKSFSHSSFKVTERYIHDEELRDQNLLRVSKDIKMISPIDQS